VSTEWSAPGGKGVDRTSHYHPGATDGLSRWLISGRIQSRQRSGEMTRFLPAPNERALHFGTCAAAIGTFLVIFAAKLALIGRYGSAVPFWDEWDAEGANLFAPFLDGRLTLSDLMAAHNEHRVLVTRLLAMAILEVGGRWDVIPQMVLNAALHSATLVMIALSLAASGPSNRKTTLAILLFTSLAGAVPFGWENTLLGFNTHFYLSIALSWACMAILVGAGAFSRRWWAGVVIGAGCLFTTASGALSLCAPLGVAVLQMLRGRRNGIREVAAMAGLAALTCLLVAAIPTVPGHAVFEAHTIGQFVGAFMQVGSWPLGPAALVPVQAPAVLLGIIIVAVAPPRSDPNWRLVGAFGWLVTQLAAIAFSRANGFPVSSRYLDLLVVGQIVGAVTALRLVQPPRPLPVRPRVVSRGVAGWFALILVGDLLFTWRHLPAAIRERWSTSLIQADHLRDYLLHGDAAGFADRDRMHLPYPDPDRLREILDNPDVRAILPISLGGDAPESWLTHAAACVVGAWPALLVTGLVVLVGSSAFAAGRLPPGKTNPCPNVSPDASRELNVERS
jgi:hypothetical protein